MPIDELAPMAAEAGFVGLSMRASAVSVDTPKPRIHEIRALLDRYGLSASMVMGSVPLAANSPDAPSYLRNITLHLELAEILGTTLVRVMIRTAADIPFAQRAADEAGERGIVLAQQNHWGTLVETVDETLDLMLRIERLNFGATFEPANLLACGDNNGPDALRHLMPYLVNFYFQNIRLDPSGAHTFMTRTRGPVSLSYLPLDDPLGIEISPLIDVLREYGCAGRVSVHQPLRDGQSVEDALAEAARVFVPLVA